MMHQFSELVVMSTSFALSALDDAQSKVLAHLHKHSDTPSIKTLQMIVLQKSIIAIGSYSLFESMVQERLTVKNGFKEVLRILDEQGEFDLRHDFESYYLAINVLKHGQGRSYDKLASRHDALPFRIKMPTESFFFEGDVSEVNTLVQVDDTFIMGCAKIIQNVSRVIERARPGCFI